MNNRIRTLMSSGTGNFSRKEHTITDGLDQMTATEHH